MRFLFLCIILFCGNLWAQTSVQETISTGYSPWSLSAFSLMSLESDQINSGGSLFSYNYIGPNYRLNFDERLSFKMPFLANSTGYDRFNDTCVQEQNMEIADPFFNYSNYNLALLPGEIDVYWDGRVYLPLSKNSRRQKMIGRLRSQFILSRLVTQNVQLEWRNLINFYHQSKSTYTAQGTNDQCQVGDNAGPSNTRRFRMENWLSTWYRVNRRWSLGVTAMFREDMRNQSSTVITSRQRNGRLKETSLRFGPTVRWIASHNLSFIASYNDVLEYSGFHPERQDNLSDLGTFKSENTEVVLSSFIRF